MRPTTRRSCYWIFTVMAVLLMSPQLVEAARLTQELKPLSLTRIPVGGAVTLNPQSSSGLKAKVISKTMTVCKVRGYAVTGLKSGACYLVISQPGNKQYLPATPLYLAVEVQAESASVTPDTNSSNDNCSAPSPVISRCQQCHVSGGHAGFTGLVFDAAGSSASREQVIKQYLSSTSGALQSVLNKIVGVGHGGGAIVLSTSPEYAQMACYLKGLSVSDSATPTPSPLNPDQLFSNVKLATPGQILRRASIILAGRPPTANEVNQVSSGDIGALRKTIKGLMQGPAFHDFIISGANDRLLTDAFLNGTFLEISDGNRTYYPLLAEKKYSAYLAGKRTEFNDFQYKLSMGLARSPLELIYHIVSNDKSYTEILTADYMMLNPQASEVYRSNLKFNSDDSNQFQPGKNSGQIYSDSNLVSKYVEDIGANITQHGAFIDVPIVGLLSTGAFLDRYPTTDTNRNRARARWTFKHFLGIDIEKSASRTTDPVALADKNNPTLLNPNCTVCHQVLDPVAASFADWDDHAYYRAGWMGQDSLPNTYKYPPQGQFSPYVRGDLWYRDMRPAGLQGASTPAGTSNPLRWVAEEIVKKDEFAIAAINFWWPALMGAEVLSAPESASDAQYAAQLVAFEAQQKDIRALGQLFKTGDSNVRAYNLKDILVEMMLTPWFSGDSVNGKLSSAQEASLSGVGTGRLLTPEELDAKTTSIIGAKWGQSAKSSTWNTYHPSHLRGQYQVAYGGIDSMSVVNRSREINALMSNVATRQAIDSSCEAVVFDFGLPEGSRRLFNGITKDDVPTTKAGETLIRAKLSELHALFWGKSDAPDSSEVTKSFELLKGIWINRSAKNVSYLTAYNDEICPIYQSAFAAENMASWPNTQNFWDNVNQKQRDALLQDRNRMLVTWKNMLISFMTDYRYLYE